MSSRIFKYEIPSFEFDLDLQIGAEVRFVSLQKGKPYIWVELPQFEGTMTEKRQFRVFGTGHPIEEHCKYIGSWQHAIESDAEFVWHLFEKRVPFKKTERSEE